MFLGRNDIPFLELHLTQIPFLDIDEDNARIQNLRLHIESLTNLRIDIEVSRHDSKHGMDNITDPDIEGIGNRIGSLVFLLGGLRHIFRMEDILIQIDKPRIQTEEIGVCINIGDCLLILILGLSHTIIDRLLVQDKELDESPEKIIDLR